MGASIGRHDQGYVPATYGDKFQPRTFSSIIPQYILVRSLVPRGKITSNLATFLNLQTAPKQVPTMRVYYHDNHPVSPSPHPHPRN